MIGERAPSGTTQRKKSLKAISPGVEGDTLPSTAAGFSLLIVDDDSDLALNLKDILEAEGYHVEVAFRGRDALALCQRRTFDLTLIDIELPDMSGLHLLDQIGGQCPGTECIVITGHAALDTAIAAVGLKRIISYETKPLDLARLMSLIRQVRERQQTEEALRRSETRLSLVLGQVPCILWATDARFNMTSLSGASASFFDRQISVGKLLKAIENSDDSRKHPTPRGAHLSALSGVPQTYELRWRGKDLYCRVEPLRDKGDSITGVIGIAVDISEQKRRERELRALSQRVEDAQERERNLVARELHDEFGQTLTALKISLDRAAVGAEGPCGNALREASVVTGNLMAGVREFSFDLRPTMLDDLGLAEALLWYAEKFSKQTGIRVSLKHSGPERQLPPSVGTAAYRITQEALTNVARHAHVKEVSVCFWLDEKSLQLQIEDSGSGFDPRKLSVEDSVGISGMRERALSLGGTFTLDSAPGRGTSITVGLPLSVPSGEGRHRRKQR